MPRNAVLAIQEFGGLNIADPPYALRDNEAQEMWDLVIAESGALKLRGGYERFGTLGQQLAVRGLHRFYTPTVTQLLVAAGTGLWVEQPDGSFVDVVDRDLPGEIRTPDRVHRFATWDWKQECYAVNGADRAVKWDGQKATALDNAPIAAQHVLVYANRLWMGNLGLPDGPTTLRWSDLADPESWPAENMLEVSQPITGLLAGFGTTAGVWSQYPSGMLYIFEPGRIEVLVGDGGRETTAGLRVAVDGVGCVAPNTLCTWAGYAFFLGADGLYMWDGRNAPREISRKKLGPLLVDLPPLARQKAWATIADGKLWLALPQGGSLENRVIYAYDLARQAWLPFRIAATCLFGTPGNPQEDLELLFGDTEGNVWKYRPDLREDARIPPNPGTPIKATWRSKVFVPLEGYIIQFRHFRMELKASDADTYVNWTVDYGRAAGAFTFSARVPAGSLWDIMLWDEGYWADESPTLQLYRDSFPMQAQGRTIEFEMTMQGDAGWQGLQVLGYPVRELR